MGYKSEYDEPDYQVLCPHATEAVPFCENCVERDKRLRRGLDLVFFGLVVSGVIGTMMLTGQPKALTTVDVVVGWATVALGVSMCLTGLYTFHKG